MYIPTPRTLGDMLRQRAGQSPDSVAIRYEDSSITYAGLDAAVDKAARLLMEFGIHRGDRVALMLPNCPEMLVFDFACFRLGATAVPVNSRYQRAEAAYALSHSGASLLIADSAFLPIVDGLERECDALRHLLLRGGNGERERDVDRLLAGVEASPVEDAASAEDAAVIFYTSGSTAKPKGVVHTHAGLLGQAGCQGVTREMAPGRRWLIATGIGYVAGLAGVSVPGLYSGVTLVVEEDLSADALLRAIERERAHAAVILPTKLLDMLESPLADSLDLSSFEQVYVGGDECSHALYQRFRARFGYDLAQLLGMTECEGYLTNRPGSDNRIGSVGEPAREVRVRLISSDGTEVCDGRAGELQVHAPGLMQGYWQDPDTTQRTLVDGWLLTGDVARRDSDGYYWFIERKREIVIHDGSNIAPHEVEDVIDSHPDVAESCVVGVSDPRHGAVLEAFVEPEAGASGLAGEMLTAWLKHRIAAYKIPTLWRIVGELPRTATGKMDRKALHARAASEHSAGPGPAAPG